MYPQLREINLGPISGQPRRCRGTNDFPQRRTRSNETVRPVVHRKYTIVHIRARIMYIMYVRCAYMAAFFRRPTRQHVSSRARDVGFMEILNRASRCRYVTRYPLRYSNVTATYAARHRSRGECRGVQLLSLRDHKLTEYLYKTVLVAF